MEAAGESHLIIHARKRASRHPYFALRANLREENLDIQQGKRLIMQPTPHFFDHHPQRFYTGVHKAKVQRKERTEPTT